LFMLFPEASYEWVMEGRVFGHGVTFTQISGCRHFFSGAFRNLEWSSLVPIPSHLILAMFGRILD
jgi:hypothetical protein